MQAIVVIVVVWGSQCDRNSGGGNASGDLENFGCAVITNQLQTLTTPLTNRHQSSSALFLASMTMLRNFDASKGEQIDVIKVSIVERLYYMQFSLIILVFKCHSEPLTPFFLHVHPHIPGALHHDILAVN